MGRTDRANFVYTNPVTGRPALATIDCYLVGLDGDHDTKPFRTNSNAVCVVVEGDGTSDVGGETITWGKNDIFTLPHGHWISHRATSADAKLFQISDREILARLEILREELRP